MKRTQATYLIAAAAGALTVLVYLPALGNAFVNWDDMGYVVDNLHIREWSWAFLKWAFTDRTVAGYWHPLPWLSHALDYLVWGLKPWGHHLTSIVLHGLNTALVVLLATELYGRGMRSESVGGTARRTDLIAAGTVGLLFGIHPLRVESVAWVSERKDLLCAFFFLLAVFAYVTARNGENGAERYRFKVFSRRYLVVLGMYLLALLSKPMAVTLPLVLLLLDYYPYARIHSTKTLLAAIREKIPFFILSAALSVATVLAQQGERAVIPIAEVSIMDRIFTACRSVVLYLGKTVVPIGLSPFYPNSDAARFFPGDRALSVLLVGGITLGCLLAAKRHKVLLVAWGYFLITLLPVLGLVRVGSVFMADRFTYLPSLGPLLLIGMGIAVPAGPVERENRKVFRAVLYGSAVAWCLMLAVLTVRQIGVWKNGFSLWNAVIHRDPLRIPAAYTNRGEMYARNGDLNAAMRDFTKAVKLDRKYTEGYIDRGWVLWMQGRLGESLQELDRAVALDPLNSEAYYYRGKVYQAEGQQERAVSDFTAVIERDPRHAGAYTAGGRSSPGPDLSRRR